HHSGCSSRERLDNVAVVLDTSVSDDWDIHSFSTLRHCGKLPSPYACVQSSSADSPRADSHSNSVRPCVSQPGREPSRHYVTSDDLHIGVKSLQVGNHLR